MEVDLRRRAGARLAAMSPEVGDAALYGASAAFAALTALFSTISLYRVWGQLALGVYLVAAVVSLLLWRARRHDAAITAAESPEPPAPAALSSRVREVAWSRRWRSSRRWVFLFVLVGATLFPLAILATMAGVWLVRRVPADRFYNIVYGLTFLIGLRLVWEGGAQLLG